MQRRKLGGRKAQPRRRVVGAFGLLLEEEEPVDGGGAAWTGAALRFPLAFSDGAFQ